MDEIRRLKRTNYLALAVVVVFAAACVLGLLALRERHRFSREKWLQDPENRTRIVDDLLANHELVGMTEEEMDALQFGRPVLWLSIILGVSFLAISRLCSLVNLP